MAVVALPALVLLYVTEALVVAPHMDAGAVTAFGSNSSGAALITASRKTYQPSPPTLQETYMRYMPHRNLVVCGCAKCGTSSLWGYIYNVTFGQAWPYGGSKPYIHSLTTSRWNNTWSLINDPAQQGDIMSTAFSIAIVRDPMERLVSAWKSKLACGMSYHTDWETRAWMTQELLKVNGSLLKGNVSSDRPQCLTLTEFLRVLESIHKHHDAWLLDRHFLPQHMGCFYRFPPEEWSAVVSLEQPEAMETLARSLGTAEVQQRADHASTSKVQLDEEQASILERITRLEYKVFGRHLPRESYVKAGEWV